MERTGTLSELDESLRDAVEATIDAMPHLRASTKNDEDWCRLMESVKSATAYLKKRGRPPRIEVEE